MTSEALPTTANQPAHSYATRIRHNNTPLKPAVRVRYDPEPLHASPTPAIPRVDQDIPISDLAPFPSPDVVLHPDDANSKVFHAIARALLSVDNRAMTVKDLAETCVTQGLHCQNLNAASQAITTYTRDHLKRCEQEKDQPLLLRHILSGTPSDDLLAPALHSTHGGGCPPVPRQQSPTSRITNFRKGTVIWYLSRVTGAPCPFARAGIRLCDHVDPSLTLPKPNARRSKEAHVDQCGDKRKRRSTRECVVRAGRRSGSRSPGASDGERSDAEAPPAKVKLIVRLKPLAKCFSATPAPTPPSASSPVIDLSLSDDESDSMSVDDSDSDSPDPEDHSSQLFPRRSMSIPPYTPSNDFAAYGSYQASHVTESGPFTRYRRSTSVPYSMASPPPDSDDEMDDDDEVDSAFGESQTASAPHPQSPFDNDNDDRYESSEFSSEFGDNDADTSFESPGPRSPFSAPPVSLPSIKQEARDVQGILDAWDDMEGSSVYAINGPTTEEAKVVEVIGKAATCVLMEAGHIKEEVDGDWDTVRYRLSSSPFDVKQEDESSDLSLDFQSSPFTAWRNTNIPVSPLSAASPGFDFDDESRFDDFPSPLPRRGSESFWNRDDRREHESLRPRANTVASLGGFFGAEEFGPDQTSTLTRSLTSLIESLSVTTHSLPEPETPCDDEREGSAPPPVCVSPSDMRITGNCSWARDVESVMVRTSQPSSPAIFVTRIDGVFVYQASLGCHIVLRRLDNNFVNLSGVLSHSKTTAPAFGTLPSAVMVTEGPHLLRGLWVSLDAARAYARDHPIPSALSSGPPRKDVLDLFLDPQLSAQFPSDLIEDAWRHNAPGVISERFGHLQAGELLTRVIAAGSSASAAPPEAPSSPSEPRTLYDEPLTAKEEEIFQSICVNLEWEDDEPALEPTPPIVAAAAEPEPEATPSSSTASEPAAPQLRRSLRVREKTTKSRR